MSLEMSLTSDGTGLIFEGAGVISEQEIVDANLELLASEEQMKRVTFARIDLSKVERLEIALEGIQRVAEVDKRVATFAPGLRVAVIATRDQVFGLARMWEMFADSTGWKTNVVRTAAEADVWLAAQLAPARDRQPS